MQSIREGKEGKWKVWSYLHDSGKWQQKEAAAGLGSLVHSSGEIYIDPIYCEQKYYDYIDPIYYYT